MPRFVPHSSSPLPVARKLVAAVALAASLGALLSVPQSASALQRVSGDAAGDFESASSPPPGWSWNAPYPNRVYTSTSVAISGARSLKLEDTSTTLGTSAQRAPVAVAPGVEYELQAYAHAWKGHQTLALRFEDAKGAVIARSTTSTTDALSTWSRLTVRATAPTGAVRAVAEMSSATTTTSQVWWDAVQLLRIGILNSGFETAPTSGSLTGWTTTAPRGTSVTTTTATARLGQHSLSTVDSSTSAALKVVSSRIPVFPAVAHTMRAWVRPTSGAFVITVRFLDSSLATVSSTKVDARKPAGVWGLVTKQLTAPPTARTATIEMASAASTTGSATWDALDLRPTAGGAIRTHTTGRALQPVDDISNTNVSRVIVVAGRPKLLGIVSGQPAELQVADIQSGAVEYRFPLGQAAIGWALAVGSDGAVYTGTNDGHVRRWVPGAAVVTDLGRPSTRATAVWDLETAPDGRVWGVSYPSAELWSWSPDTERFSVVGSMSSTHQYARSLAIAAGHAWVGLGSENPAIMKVQLSDPSKRSLVRLPTTLVSGIVSEIEAQGRYLAVRTPSGATSTGTNVTGERRLFDTETGRWAAANAYPQQRPSNPDSTGTFYYVSATQLLGVSASTGASSYRGYITTTAGRDRTTLRATFGGVVGEWMTVYDPVGTVSVVEVDTREEQSYRVRFLPTKMRIKSIASGPGSVFVGGYGGSSLAVLDDSLTTKRQYPEVPYAAGVIGEVEGSIAMGTLQYLGTYTDAGIFRYDTTRPWSDGSNPAKIATLGPTYQQDRPLAWATSGSRVFFGTVPRYGVLGGTLGIIEGDTSAPRIVREPVVDQSVVSLAAFGSVVYGGTSRWGGLGAKPTQPSAKVFAYDSATNRKLWEATPASGVEAYGAVMIGPAGTLWAANGTTLIELDPASGATLRTVVLQAQGAQTTPTLRNAALATLDGVLYLVAAGKLYSFDPSTLRVDVLVTSGINTPQIVVRPGSILVPMSSVLQEIVFS